MKLWILFPLHPLDLRLDMRSVAWCVLRYYLVSFVRSSGELWRPPSGVNNSSHTDWQKSQYNCWWCLLAVFVFDWVITSDQTAFAWLHYNHIGELSLSELCYRYNGGPCLLWRHRWRFVHTCCLEILNILAQYFCRGIWSKFSFLWCVRYVGGLCIIYELSGSADKLCFK